MFLKKITLKNFRQFYGKQEISFSTNPEKNVTLIHGENGVGKTTFLNALFWCFYKTHTEKFEDIDKIVSDQAKTEGDFEVFVEVLFNHNNEDYLVRRKANEKVSDEEFKAFLIEEGNYKPLPDPTVFVESVVPREMADYFFFDGEYAETFSSRDNSKIVRDAVENMLGCNIAIQAGSDLKAVKKSLEKDILELTNKNSSARAFQTKIDALEKDIGSDEGELANIKKRLEQLNRAKEEITDTLRNSGETENIQQNKEKEQATKEEAENTKNTLEAKRAKWIDKYSIGLLSNKARQACKNIIDDANVKGKIPSRFSEPFVSDILKDRTCICNRQFEVDSKEERAIKNLLSEAGTAKVNDRMIKIGSKMGGLEKLEKEALEEFSNINKELEGQKDKIDACEKQIKEYSARLKNIGVLEIEERQKALDEIEENIRELTLEEGSFKQSYGDIKKDIKRLEGNRDKLLPKNSHAEGVKKKIDFLENSIGLLNSELDKYREEARIKIIEKVNHILKKATRRHYFAGIDESFNLNMFYEQTKARVAKSGGEHQLLSLAFIASLVSFAADRRKEKEKFLKPGTMAPLMLDSPFGDLDASYRKSTSEFLPELAEQVVLLVTKAQGDSDVIKALNNKIGLEYVLISEVRGSQDEKPDDIIKLHGKEIACSLYECEKNRTKIHQIE